MAERTALQVTAFEDFEMGLKAGFEKQLVASSITTLDGPFAKINDDSLADRGTDD